MTAELFQIDPKPTRKDRQPTMKTPKAEWVTITPALAKDYLEHNRGNRKQNDRHVSLLAKDMSGSGFLVTGDTIKFDRNGRLIDGQHRLAAIVASGVAQMVLVVTGLDPMVQSVIDAQKRRTAADALSFVFDTANTTVLAAIARLDLSIASMRNPTVFSRPGAGRVSNTQVVDWVNDNLDALDYAARGRTLGYKHSDVRLPASVGGWLWMQFGRLDAERADAFFAPMLDRHIPFGTDQIKPEHDPRWVYMQTVNRFNTEDRVSLKPIVFGVRAWNTWRRGHELRMLRPTTGGAHGAGTPMALEVPR